MSTESEQVQFVLELEQLAQKAQQQRSYWTLQHLRAALAIARMRIYGIGPDRDRCEAGGRSTRSDDEQGAVDPELQRMMDAIRPLQEEIARLKDLHSRENVRINMDQDLWEEGSAKSL